MNPLNSIRSNLLLNISGVVLLIGGAMLITTLSGASHSARSLSSSLINQSLQQTDAHLKQLFDPIREQLLTARSWGERGLLRLDDPERLNRLLVPFMQQHNHVSAVLLADEHGNENMLRRDQLHWSHRLTRPEDWQQFSLLYTWTSGAESMQPGWHELAYDPRTRPWYQQATRHADATGGELITWTDPYIFFTAKEPGITAATLFTAPDGKRYVLGIDVLLTDISKFTSALRIGEHGKVTVLTRDNRIIGLPYDASFIDEAARRDALLRAPEDLGVRLATDAAAAFAQQAKKEHDPLRFVSEHVAWWGESQPFALSHDQSLVVTVLVPEKELLGSAADTTWWIVSATMIVLLFSLWRALALARRFSDPIEQLVAQSERISRGDLKPGRTIQAKISEVRRLADAHEKMRSSLQTLITLEQDLQVARQIQQRFLPQHLPQLSGYDIDARSQPANATGGDTYDVIGIAHTDNAMFRVQHENARDAMLLLADATGHGIGPALSVTQVRAMLRMAVRLNTPIPEMARHFNDQLSADLHEGRFVTAWLGHLDTVNHRLNYFSAGQAPLFWYRAHLGHCELLAANAPPFGVLADMTIELPPAISLEPGDMFAVVSDGILDARDNTGIPLSEQRVSALLRQHADQNAAQWVQTLFSALEHHAQGTTQKDDQTVIVIKRLADAI